MNFENLKVSFYYIIFFWIINECLWENFWEWKLKVIDVIKEIFIMVN